ncbi:MAG TPA: hypothetical protein VMZ52_08145 [Bryobacteraceae bacterium]|nr:hypothetical protein [Bryobacteraceae bacterium]
MIHKLLLALWIVLLTAVSFFHFPGHTILQSDTQIYIPILERLWDQSLFTRDIMALHPHVAFTVYDEVAIALRRITGAEFEPILMAQQFLFRAAGIAGLYLLGTGIGFSTGAAMLVTCIASLSTFVNGPAVILVEYEPVPRGFALPCLVLALGLVAHSRWKAAALATAVAFVFHPPTALAFYLCLLGLILWKRQYQAIWPLAAAAAIMTGFVLAQPPVADHLGVFSRLSPELEKLQRMRASYNWVSIWIRAWASQYAFLWIVGMVALYRLRERIRPTMLLLLAGLPLIGILSLPLSWILLENLKLAVISQFQPGRYLLYVPLFAMILCPMAGIVAAQRRRYLEALLFFLVPFAMPMQYNIFDVVLGKWDNMAVMHRIELILGLSAGAVAIAIGCGRPKFGPVVTLAALLPFFLIPQFGQVRNYAAVHHRELNELAAWARSSTSKDALFQFADAGQNLTPGIFRARSLRALYVDWKSGGQVNFLKEFSSVWWERWQRLEKPQPLPVYRDLGIDYVVFSALHPQPDAQPLYQNSKYLVYDVRPPRN